MRYFKKHVDSIGATFRMYTEAGMPVFDLGPSVTLVLRQLLPKSTAEDGVVYLKYVVEILESDIHYNNGFRKGKVALFRVPITEGVYDRNDIRLAMQIFTSAAFGQTHTLGLQEFVVGKDHGHLLTVNGLFWDGTISHVKDIQTK